jgi:AcrR family transcriptional regulator
MPTATVRRTQAARSDATRARLLDTTLDLLVEVGWARTTTQLVAERAGLSRGAQLHHFPTKADLVVSAVTHLARKRAAEVRADAERRRATAREGGGVEVAVDLLADVFDGPLFLASLELWTAARTDTELRDALLPLERQLGRDLRALSRDLAGADPDRDDEALDLALDLTVELVRGLGIAALLDPAGADRRRRRLLAAWRSSVLPLLATEGSS